MSNAINWACPTCTYHNEELSSHCEICQTQRDCQSSSIDDEEFARQLQAQFDKEAQNQNQPQTPGGDNNNHNHNRRRPEQPTPSSDNDSSNIVPRFKANSLEPRMESLTTAVKRQPPPSQSTFCRSPRWV